MSMSMGFQCPVCKKRADIGLIKKPKYFTPAVVRFTCTGCECKMIITAKPKRDIASDEYLLDTNIQLEYVSSKGHLLLESMK